MTCFYFILDRESLPEAGANFSKQETCPWSTRQEGQEGQEGQKGTTLCEECWSGI